MWNTAVMGDNDFMHHQVERIGPRHMGPPENMTLDTLLDHDGEQWVVTEEDEVLARYDDEHVRLSLSWKAKVYADVATRAAADAGEGAIDAETALGRFADIIDEPLAATGPDALASPELREQLHLRFAGYRTG